MADRIAWELTADPVPIERAFERAAAASINTNKIISQQQKEQQAEIERLAKKLTDLQKIQETSSVMGKAGQERIANAIKRTAAELDSAANKAKNLGRVLSQEITKETGLIDALSIRIQRLTTIRNQSNDPAKIERINNIILKQTERYGQLTTAVKDNSIKITEQTGLIEALRIRVQRLTEARDKSQDPTKIQRINQLIEAQTQRISGLTGATKKATQETSFFTSQIEQVGGLVAGAFAIQSIIQFSSAVKQATQEMESLKRQMQAITGDEQSATAEMEFLRLKSEEFGLELVSTTKAYTAFAGAATKSGLSLSQTRDIFTSVAEASTVMGLSAEQTNSTFRALSQIISKGVVSMEELRQQLGEHIPGAFSLSLKAVREMTGNMNLTERQFNKMVESGQILSRDFLPALAKQFHLTFGEDAQKAASGMVAETNRLTNAWTELKLSLGESAPITATIKALTVMVKGLDNALVALNFAIAGVKVVGGNVGAMADLAVKMQKSAVDKYRAEKASEAQLYANNLLQSISNEKAEEQQKILMRRVATLQGARVEGKNLTDEEIRNNIELTEKAKAVYDLAKGLVDSRKEETQLTEAQTKALERQRREIEKGREAIKKWMLDRDARNAELMAGATVPDYAKGMGKTPEQLAEERAKQGVRELDTDRVMMETLFNQESQMLEDQRAYQLVSEQEYLKQKLALYQQYGKDTKDVMLDIFNNEKKMQAEALEISIQKLQFTAQSALELTGIYSNALERQQIELEEQKQKGVISEEAYQMKMRQIKRREFELNRIAAIAEIGIRTAVNATSSALAPPLLAFVIGLGAAQALVAATRPNPYAKGTKRVKGGQKGKDSVYFAGADGSHNILMPDEMIVPAKKTAEHAPYLDNMFDGKISPTQSRWASGLFVNQTIEPGLIRYMMSISGQPHPRSTGVDKLAKAILKKRNPDFNRPADRIVRAIYETSQSGSTWRKFKR